LNYQTNSKSFNIELNLKWLKASGIDETTIAGNFYLSSPDVKFIMLKVLKEFTKDDDLSATSVHLCTLDLFHQFSKMNYSKHRPPWINQLKEILHDQWSNNLSLQQLSILLKVHPVTISKYFSKYFDCTLGEYVRRIRTEKALSLIKSTDMSLGAIAYECGFADQSHFIRTFKDHTGFLPKAFRRI
jgi:AraC family transcriptional regulator